MHAWPGWPAVGLAAGQSATVEQPHTHGPVGAVARHWVPLRLVEQSEQAPL